MISTSSTAYREPFAGDPDPYRNPLVAAEGRLLGLREELARSEAAREARALVLGRRLGRWAFGFVGLAGVAVTIGLALLGKGQVLADALIDTWLAALLAYVVGRIAGATVFASRSFGEAPSPLVAIEAIRRELAAREAWQSTAAPALARSSLVLPAVFVFMISPLTIHLAYAAVSGGRPGSYVTASFGEWMALSMMIVGHAHVLGAVLAGRYGYRIATMSARDLGEAKSNGFGALGWTVLASAIPGIVFFAIPPVLVAVTGLAFMPLLWRGLHRSALRDRRLLEATGVAPR